jgi:membrane associated rhomboid family serine protease
MPHDITEPSRLYTLLTSMFMHADFTHIFLNLLMLVLIGLVFEQRIGTRPFVVLYLLAGVIGTLSFAAVRWGEPLTAAVGASGAIVGILGGFARLYPNEKMMLFPIPVPMSIWTVVLIFAGLQFLLFFGATNIAVEAHLGGLVAGVLLAPYVIRLPLRQKTRVRKVQTLSVGQLRALATTPQLKSMLDRIEHEEVSDVRSAWIEHFLSEAKCPQCGSRLRVEKGLILCEKGHII